MMHGNQVVRSPSFSKSNAVAKNIFKTPGALKSFSLQERGQLSDTANALEGHILAQGKQG
jgi:hypothetical protein